MKIHNLKKEIKEQQAVYNYLLSNLEESYDYEEPPIKDLEQNLDMND